MSGEITSNEEEIYLTRYSMLEERKDACKKINKMFGLNIDVKFRYEEKEENNAQDMFGNNEGGEKDE